MTGNRCNTKNLLLTSIVLAALTGVATGFWHLLAYAHTPGRLATPESSWPTDSAISPVQGLPTLVLALHPDCPCSRATLHELSLLLDHAPVKPTCVILFQSSAPFSATPTELVKAASDLPGVTVFADLNHEATARFHAATSGQLLLYSPTGALLFNGGITAARGHEGDNEGRAILENYFATGHCSLASTPVFGCSLQPPAPN